jgi:hypothetical protein
MTSRATPRPIGSRARIVDDTSWHGLGLGVDVTVLAHDEDVYRVRPVDWRPDSYGEWVPDRDLGDVTRDRAPEAQSDSGDPEAALLAALAVLGGLP